jgi:hypothetical protein
LKQCSISAGCGQYKPLEDFNLKLGKPRHICRKCQAADRKAYRADNLEKERERLRRYKENNREKVLADKRRNGKRYRLKYLYNMTLDDFDAMYEAQDGYCASCGDPYGKNQLVVDHNHACCPGDRERPKTCGNCVCALLCNSCNTAIGMLKESSARIEAAAAYVRKYKE